MSESLATASSGARAPAVAALPRSPRPPVRPPILTPRWRPVPAMPIAFVPPTQRACSVPIRTSRPRQRRRLSTRRRRPHRARLTATASGTQIALSWTAATDNVGVTGYRIERCQGAGCSSFAQIATTTGATSYTNTALAAGTSYAVSRSCHRRRELARSLFEHRDRDNAGGCRHDAADRTGHV